MKRIVYINSECYRDTDIPIIGSLLKKYEVDYYIILDKYGISNIDFLMSLLPDSPFFHFHVINGRYRRRDPRYFFVLFSVFKKIVFKKYALLVTAVKDDFYFCLLLLFFKNSRKLLYMVHDAEPHPIQNSSFIDRVSEIINDRIIRNTDSFLLFAQSQMELFRNKYQNKKTSIIHKPYIFYGYPTISKPNKSTTIFLFFGNISYYKGIENLIEASELLSEKYCYKFRVLIYGHSNYQAWKESIKTLSLYDFHLGYFEDSDIPNIFEQSHFLVLPYRQVTQSGPLSIAKEYHLPVIAPSVGSFLEDIQPGKNGFLYPQNDIVSLSTIMEECILMSDDYYNNLKGNIENEINAEHKLQVCNILNCFDSIIK